MAHHSQKNPAKKISKGVIKGSKNSKFPGPDGIPAEILKAGINKIYAV